MPKFEIHVRFELKNPVSTDLPPSEDALVRVLRNFEPAPTSTYSLVNTRVAEFACDAKTEFNAGVIGVDLFDRLKAHTSDGPVYPSYWETKVIEH